MHDYILLRVYTLLIETVLKRTWNVTYPELEEDIQDMIQFELKLYNIKGYIDSNDRLGLFGNKITLGQFEKMYCIPLTEITKELL